MVGGCPHQKDSLPFVTRSSVHINPLILIPDPAARWLSGSYPRPSQRQELLLNTPGRAESKGPLLSEIHPCPYYHCVMAHPSPCLKGLFPVEGGGKECSSPHSGNHLSSGPSPLHFSLLPSRSLFIFILFIYLLLLSRVRKTALSRNYLPVWCIIHPVFLPVTTLLAVHCCMTA